MAASEGLLWANATMLAHPKRPLSYRFAGIQGDTNHTYGYHCTKRQIGNKWDYSLVLPKDIAGGSKFPDDASAWDLSFNQSDMKLVTGRLLKAAQKHDPRMRDVREFCGTLNGFQTYPWDVTTDSSEGVDSWDDSHLSHVHVSVLRIYCNDKSYLLGLIEVMCGVPLSKTKVVGLVQTPVPANDVKFPLKPWQAYSKKEHSVSQGALLIQKRLQQLGYAPKAASWADGVYGQETADAVANYKKDHHILDAYRVGRRTWQSLFSSQKGK